MINRVENVNRGVIVSEKFLHHFYRKGFSAESILKRDPKTLLCQDMEVTVRRPPHGRRDGEVG